MMLSTGYTGLKMIGTVVSYSVPSKDELITLAALAAGHQVYKYCVIHDTPSDIDQFATYSSGLFNDYFYNTQANVPPPEPHYLIKFGFKLLGVNYIPEWSDRKAQLKGGAAYLAVRVSLLFTHWLATQTFLGAKWAVTKAVSSVKNHFFPPLQQEIILFEEPTYIPSAPPASPRPAPPPYTTAPIVVDPETEKPKPSETLSTALVNTTESRTESPPPDDPVATDLPIITHAQAGEAPPSPKSNHEATPLLDYNLEEPIPLRNITHPATRQRIIDILSDENWRDPETTNPFAIEEKNKCTIS